MKKHRNMKERFEPGKHKAIWSRLICSICHKVSAFGDETFFTTHANCDSQVSTAKRSFVAWLDGLTKCNRPKATDRELREDLRLSSDEEDEDLTFPRPPKAKFAKKEKPATSVKPSHEVDLDLEGVFSPEEGEMEWTEEKETEKAVSSILPPPPTPVVSLLPPTPSTSRSPPTPAAPLQPPSSPTPAAPLQPPSPPTPAVSTALPLPTPAVSITLPRPTPEAPTALSSPTPAAAGPEDRAPSTHPNLGSGST